MARLYFPESFAVSVVTRQSCGQWDVTEVLSAHPDVAHKNCPWWSFASYMERLRLWKELGSLNEHRLVVIGGRHLTNEEHLIGLPLGEATEVWGYLWQQQAYPALHHSAIPYPLPTFRPAANTYGTFPVIQKRHPFPMLTLSALSPCLI